MIGALMCLLLLSWLVFSAVRERQAGIWVDVGNVVRLGLWFLLLAAWAIYDAFVH